MGSPPEDQRLTGSGEPFDLAGFVEALASDQPLPAGGAAAALAGALAAALAEMAAGRTTSDERRATSEGTDALARQAAEWRAALLRAIEEDVAAYQGYLAARRLPRDDEAQRRWRDEAIQRALHAATLAPLNVARLANELLGALAELAEYARPALLGDLAAAAYLAEAALRGSALNARLNLRDYADAAERAELLARADQLVTAGERKREAIVRRAEGR
jgi:formiminotetrahydrofolate cyclodeaminase